MLKLKQSALINNQYYKEGPLLKKHLSQILKDEKAAIQKAVERLYVVRQGTQDSSRENKVRLTEKFSVFKLHFY